MHVALRSSWCCFNFKSRACWTSLFNPDTPTRTIFFFLRGIWAPGILKKIGLLRENTRQSPMKTLFISSSSENFANKIIEVNRNGLI